MVHLTEEYLRRKFGANTFWKGLRYFHDGNVRCVIRVDNDTLIGSVQGSADIPYVVNVNIKDLSNTCSCPLGGDCKHVVATLLSFINKKFIDLDSLVDRIRSIPKDVLYRMLKSISLSNPEIIGHIHDAIRIYLASEKGSREILREIRKRITNMFAGADLSYYGVPSLANRIRRIFRQIMNSDLNDDSKAKLLIDLLDHIVVCFGEGADDSSGVLGSTAIEISDALISLLEKSEALKSKFADQIVDLVILEDYGLEFERLIPHVVTKDNYLYVIDKLKNELVRSEVTFYNLEKFLNIVSRINDKLHLGIDLRKYIIELLPRIRVRDYEIESLIRLLLDYRLDNLASKTIESVIKKCLESKGETKKLIAIELQSFTPYSRRVMKVSMCVMLVIKILNKYSTRVRISRELLEEFLLKAIRFDYSDPSFYRELKRWLNLLRIDTNKIRGILGESTKFYYYAGKLDVALEKIGSDLSNVTLNSLIIDEALSDVRFRDKALQVLTKHMLKNSVYRHFLEHKFILDYVLENASAEDFKQILEIGARIIISKGLLEYVVLKAKHKNIIWEVMKKNLELLPFEALERIIKKLEIIDNRFIKIVLKWIHNRITKSYKYYEQCIYILKLLKNRVDPKVWGKIKSELVNKYRTRRKFIHMLNELN